MESGEQNAQNNTHYRVGKQNQISELVHVNMPANHRHRGNIINNKCLACVCLYVCLSVFHQIFRGDVIYFYHFRRICFKRRR